MAKFAALKYSNLKNEARMKAFLDKFDNKQDFLSLDNTKVKIKNLLNGKVLEKTIKIGESIQEADVVNTKMQFLYKEGDSYFFMNLESFEQTEVNKSTLEENSKWLIDGDECDIIIWNDNIKGRRLNYERQNEFIMNKKKPTRSQFEIYEYYKNKSCS